MRELTGEAVEDASCEAAGVNDLDHNTIPPGFVQIGPGSRLVIVRLLPLCDIEQWSNIAEVGEWEKDDGSRGYRGTAYVKRLRYRRTPSNPSTSRRLVLF